MSLLPRYRTGPRKVHLPKLLEGLILLALLSMTRCDLWRTAMPRRFVFRIRTKTGGIISNVSIAAKDQYEAEHRLRQRYPDCEILNCEVK